MIQTRGDWDQTTTSRPMDDLLVLQSVAPVVRICKSEHNIMLDSRGETLCNTLVKIVNIPLKKEVMCHHSKSTQKDLDMLVGKRQAWHDNVGFFFATTRITEAQLKVIHKS